MKKTSLANTFIIGITLFSMFFGAGNLIFPPLLGAQSGKEFLSAILGFIATAVIIPTIAIVAVAKHQGLKNLTESNTPTLYYNFCNISLFTYRTMCGYSTNCLNFI